MCVCEKVQVGVSGMCGCARTCVFVCIVYVVLFMCKRVRVFILTVRRVCGFVFVCELAVCVCE